MHSKLVSIIIPVYNASLFIEECLNSVINQTYQNIEIIIVNDGSTDDSLEKISNFIEEDSRFILITQENRGCSAAKNKGLELVNGDYVQYLDADDILSQDKIEKQVSALNNEINSIAVCKTIVFKNKIDDTNLEIDTDLIIKDGTSHEFLLRLWGSEGKVSMVQPNAYLIPIATVKKIGKWNESISKSPAEDGEYFTRILLGSEKVLFTSGVNYYRKLKNIASVSKGTSFDNAKDLFLTIKLSFQHFFNVSNSVKLKELYSIHLTICTYQFGNQYPEIFKLVEKEFVHYSLRGYSLRVNNLFSLTAYLIGFKNAMFLRKVFKK